MATVATVSGNGPAPAEGLWLSVSDLATARGVTKGPLSRRVARLEALGVLSPRMDGQRKLVNVAEFDRATFETTDAVRSANGTGHLAGPEPDLGANVEAPIVGHVLAREQARNAAYAADLKKLELDERIGKLLPIEAVMLAAGEISESLLRLIDQVPSRAEENAAAVAQDGVNGARTFLKSFAFDLRKRMADALMQLAAPPAPATDAPDTLET